MPKRLCLLAAALLPLSSPALAQDQADLAKAAQNPVAAMISLPFQNNTLFGVGPNDDVANVLNIQPVIPFTVGDWNIINRTIVPVIYLPDVTSGLPELPEGVSGGSTFRLGDINQSVYFSPVDSGPVIWGSGPRSPSRARPTRRSAPRGGAPGRRRSRSHSRGVREVPRTLGRRRPPAAPRFLRGRPRRQQHRHIRRPVQLGPARGLGPLHHRAGPAWCPLHASPSSFSATSPTTAARRGGHRDRSTAPTNPSRPSVRPEVRYCVLTDHSCWYDADNERLDQGESEKVVVVDRAYIEINTPIVRERLLKAGVRLGRLLNQALR